MIDIDQMCFDRENEKRRVKLLEHVAKKTLPQLRAEQRMYPAAFMEFDPRFEDVEQVQGLQILTAFKNAFGFTGKWVNNNSVLWKVFEQAADEARMNKFVLNPKNGETHSMERNEHHLLQPSPIKWKWERTQGIVRRHVVKASQLLQRTIEERSRS